MEEIGTREVEGAIKGKRYAPKTLEEGKTVTGKNDNKGERDKGFVPKVNINHSVAYRESEEEKKDKTNSVYEDISLG